MHKSPTYKRMGYQLTFKRVRDARTHAKQCAHYAKVVVEPFGVMFAANRQGWKKISGASTWYA